MTSRELRRALRLRRRDLRRSIEAARREASARVQQMPQVRREKKRRRIRRALVVASLLLLACLVRCDCHPAPAVKAEARAVERKEKKPEGTAPVRRGPLRAQLVRQPRPGYQGSTATAPGWLNDFRLQVAARSTRLAQCFSGSAGPGALRWTSSVNPDQGTVSDHVLEPVGPSAELSREQRECVVGALSAPSYRLKAPKSPAVPDRIGLVIEF